MCSTSNLDQALSSVGVGAPAPSTVPLIAPPAFLANRDKFFLVDVRGEVGEAEEAAASLDKLGISADVHTTLGKIAHGAAAGALTSWAESGKRVVTVCNIGYRSGLAARELRAHGIDAASLDRGVLALSNPAAVRPDFVVLVAINDHPEKITIALSAAANRQGQGKQTTLVFMSDGVALIRKAGAPCKVPDEVLRLQDVVAGEPFPPAATLLDKFLKAGGVVLGCTSCVKHRGLAFGDSLEAYAQPMQMPDLLRGIEDAKGSLQFT